MRACRMMKRSKALSCLASILWISICNQVASLVARIVVDDAYRFAIIRRSKKKTDRHDTSLLARFLKLGWLPEVNVPSREIRQLRQLFHARENLIRITTKLKNIGHAALTRNGIAKGRSAFVGPRSRAKLERTNGLAAMGQQLLELTLRQI